MKMATRRRTLLNRVPTTIRKQWKPRPIRPTSQSSSTAPAGPAVRRLARELGVDLSRVRGTGPDGRITRDDVINAVRHANAAAGHAAPAGQEDRDGFGIIRREAMSKIRKTIAANMVRSATTIPHLTNFDDADITDLDRLRKESATAYANSGIKLTSLAFVLKAVALALEQHPTLNASLDMESGEIMYKQLCQFGRRRRYRSRPDCAGAARRRSAFDSANRAGNSIAGRQGARRQTDARRSARRHLHHQQHGRRRRAILNADHQFPGSRNSSGRPFAQNARW